MTCEHIVTKEMIELNESLQIFYDNEKSSFNINLNNEERFIRDYRYLNIDATIIEILEKDNISENYFLSPFENKDYQFKNKEIYIFHYPNGGKLDYSTGNIKNIDPFLYNFNHLTNTSNGSGGAPIFLKDTNLVIGIHKQKSKINNENIGNFIWPIIISLKNDFSYIKENYEGEYRNSLKEGYGKCIYENSNYYIGEWKNGLRNGKGVIYNKKGEIIYKGNFKNDKYNGYGEYFYEDGKYYIGQWENGERNGKGILYYENNKIQYEGDFKDDKFNGYGKYFYEDGKFYIGEWNNGEKSGDGIEQCSEEKNKCQLNIKISDENNKKVTFIYEDDPLYWIS